MTNHPARTHVHVLALALALVGCVSPDSDDDAGRTAQRSEPTTRPETGSPRSTPTSDPRGTHEAKPTARTPAVAPAHSYVFPIAGCRADFGRAHHGYPATDIFASRGCAVVSPVDGRIDERGVVDRWAPGRDGGATRGGRFVSVVGRDGVRYYGSHLDSVAPAATPGTTVQPGDRLGSVGNSGNARGIQPHLHFGLSWPTRTDVWWVRRGVVSPWRYLQSWRRGRDRSPVPAVRDARARAGSAVPDCRDEC